MPSSITYTMSSRVRVAGTSPGSVNIARVVDCGNGDEWQPWVASSSSVPYDGWQEIRGTFTVDADCALTKMQVHFESATASDFYVDDIVVGP